MRSRTSGSIGGRPGWPVLRWVHFFLTSSRCQRSSVSGRTTNEDQLLLVSARLAAAKRTRSRRSSRGAYLTLQELHLVAEHQELDVLLLRSATSGSEQTADQEVQERDSMELLPVAESACYGCRRLGIGKLNPSG
jgi:hypothetical protein